MPRRKPKLREDVAERAYRTLQEALGERPKTIPPSERTEEQKNPEAIKRGRKGGAVSGRKQTDALTQEERSERAREAARKRWSQPRKGT